MIGDEKGPFEYAAAGAELWTLERQRGLPFEFARVAPLRHYARKNLGYLIAISRGAECIYETDDDNEPNARWFPRAIATRADKVSRDGWTNVYRAFTSELIWPRGFPLELVRDDAVYPLRGEQVECVAPIQQGLADLSPDIDAVWRLILDREFYFENSPSVLLSPGTWCPFNSQTTWWWPASYPLLYLPAYCSFRMTDIWRSFVAQRCLWEMGYGIVFHAPEAVQQRNEHKLIKDFEAEISGYLQNDNIVDILMRTELKAGESETGSNLRRCYQALIRSNIFPDKELELVDAWLADISERRTIL